MLLVVRTTKKIKRKNFTGNRSFSVLTERGMLAWSTLCSYSMWSRNADIVRNMISGSPDRETNPIRALIGGGCRVWQ
jgi:hypothetical protein